MIFNSQVSADIFFTIIIPTRERVDTLAHSVASALSQDYDNFQVLVSDNYSSDTTEELIKSIKDERLKYIKTQRRVSMSENWEYALSHVDSGWVVILGDDDALLPGALARVNNIVAETGVDAVRSRVCKYIWPGFAGAVYGSLSVGLGRGYEERPSREMLQLVLDGSSGYEELPMLYNGGFVSFNLIKRAKEVSGNFYQSMIPDVYSAIVFSLLTKSYIYSREPLAINGASLHSGGTAIFERNSEKRSYDPAAKFWSEGNIPFHEDLPLLENGRPVNSVKVIVYESFLQARRFFDVSGLQVSHSAQLISLLSDGNSDDVNIISWAKLFSEKHGLPLPKIKKNFFDKFHFKMGNFFKRAFGAVRIYSLRGTSTIPMRNVADAAIVAGVIREIQPSLFGVIRRHIENRIGNGKNA